MLEGVEMIFIESLFRHRRSKLSSSYSTDTPYNSPDDRCTWGRDFVHVTCHQLYACVPKVLAALIDQGYPSNKFQHIGFGRRNHVITSVPVHASSDITELRRCSTRLVR